MEEAQLIELGQLFDEFMYGDPALPATRQAQVCFKAVVRPLYATLSEEMRQKLTFERYISAIVIPEVLAYLDKRQAKYPVITPEIVRPKDRTR